MEQTLWNIFIPEGRRLRERSGRYFLCLQSLIIEETKGNTQPILNW